MAGAGYKQWVDGDILTAGDVNTYLMDQAVMVFADASARTSAIAAPSEGMVTYLTGTNVIEYYDGAAWVNTNAQSGSMILIANTDFTATSSAEIDNCFTSTYENYVIYFDFVGSQTSSAFFQFRVGGVNATGSDYCIQRFTSDSATNTGQYNTATAFYAGAFTTTEPVVGSATIFGPQLAVDTGWTAHSVTKMGGTTPALVLASAGYQVTTQFDGFRIYAGAGTFTGTIRVYGLSDS